MFFLQSFFCPEGLLDILDNVQKPQSHINSVGPPQKSFNKKAYLERYKTGYYFNNKIPKPGQLKFTGNDFSTDLAASDRRSNVTQQRRKFRSPPKIFPLSIDHIIEQIFLSLDRRSLMSCRLVCRFWNYFASKQLQKTVTLTFDITPSWFYGLFQGITSRRRGAHPVKQNRFRYFTSLIQKSPQFPCTSFKFRNFEEVNFQGRYFLNKIGPFIKKLELHGGYSNAPIPFDVLRKILLNYAPCLEHLILGSPVTAMTQASLKPKAPAPSPLLYALGFRKSPNVKLNLKILEFKANVPEPLFTEILEMSPKLNDVTIGKSKNLHLFTKPITNRLYLLKFLKLVICSVPEIITSLEALANVPAECEHYWAVKKLYFQGEYFRKMSHNTVPEAVSIVSKILKSVSPTVEKVVWGHVECLKSLFEFPTMPLVKELVLTLSLYNRTVCGAQRISNNMFFPPELDLEKIFPNLKIVHLFCHPEYPNISLSLGNYKQVKSVTRCFAYGYRLEVDKLRCFQAIFSNSMVIRRDPDHFDRAYWGLSHP